MNAKAQKEIKSIDKKVNKLVKRTKRVKIRDKPQNRKPKNITHYIKPKLNAIGFRGTDPHKTLSNVQMFRKQSRNEYIAGLVHPDIAVREAIPLKLPSDLPLPTASIGFHEQYQFTTSSVGTFLMSWRPNFLATVPALGVISSNAYSKLTFNNSASLNGNTSVTGNFFVNGAYVPNVDLQRYRLVSALIKVEYNGSVLNQAGTMISCCSFDPFQIAVGSVTIPVTTLSDGLVDRFGVFSLIANGLWNGVTDITTSGHGLEGLFVPMDPSDVMFDRIPSYYGVPIIASSGVFSPGLEGAPISYLFAGRNMPASSSCVLVNVYYNFEVIPDPSVAPILRTSTKDVPSKKEGREIGDSLSLMFKNNSLMRTISNVGSSEIFQKIAKLGLSYMTGI